MIYYATVRLKRRASFFDNWQLEIKENYNSYSEIKKFLNNRFLAKRIRAHDGCLGIGRR